MTETTETKEATPATETSPEVKLEPENHRFAVHFEGSTAVLDFKKVGEKVFDFRRTFVPPDLRGHGLAGKIVKTALGWAREQNVKIIPTCSYVKAYVDRHPDEQDLVAEG